MFPHWDPRQRTHSNQRQALHMAGYMMALGDDPVGRMQSLQELVREHARISSLCVKADRTEQAGEVCIPEHAHAGTHSACIGSPLPHFYRQHATNPDAN